MSVPILVEESTPFRLSSNLENIAKTLSEGAVHHDYVMALVIVLMTEAGFSIATKDNDQGYRYSGLLILVTVYRNSDLNPHRLSKTSLVIPDDWRSEITGNYTVRFYLDQVPERECKIVAIPSGDTLILNLILDNEDKRVFSKAVQTVKYVNIYSSDLPGRYLNLKEFSFGFKNALSTPARGEVLSSAGITNPSLRGLPAEMKIRILEMLDVNSLAKVARISKEFFELSREPRIWRQLLINDFDDVNPDTINDDYYEKYKNNYIRIIAVRIVDNIVESHLYVP